MSDIKYFKNKVLDTLEKIYTVIINFFIKSVRVLTLQVYHMKPRETTFDVYLSTVI